MIPPAILLELSSRYYRFFQRRGKDRKLATAITKTGNEVSVPLSGGTGSDGLQLLCNSPSTAAQQGQSARTDSVVCLHGR
jgi:hypothetical protein